MSQLVAIAYDDEANARAAAEDLRTLAVEHQIKLDDIAVVTRDEEGKVKLDQALSPARAGAAGGALWGGLIGLIFLMPLLGMAIGAGTGALAGSLADYGIDDRFMKELGDKLKPGNAALFVLFQHANPDKVLPEVSRHGGEVLRTSLSDEAEETLRAALAAHPA
ncbi:MAG: DUF1269 domain-containing protein [Thermoleophilaceae bacterium]|nr:DUF1269 domain-containing protein [Thermoleophilaceae bacterium]